MLANSKSTCTAPSPGREWKAHLKLAFEPSSDKAVLRRSHVGPLMVQRPFYPEGKVCHAYMLHPPGGIVGGDRLRVEVNGAAQAHGLVTTPGAAKFYGSDGRPAVQQQLIKLTGGALEWMPQDTIYFNQCRASQLLRIELSSSSRFIGWEVSCFGRPAGNYGFDTGEVSSRLEIYIDNQPQLIERLLVRGAEDITRLTGLRGATVTATMVAAAPDIVSNEWLEITREALPQHTEFAATQIDGLLIVRYLGCSAEVARNGFTRVWQSLRPVVMQRPAVLPRIWST